MILTEAQRNRPKLRLRWPVRLGWLWGALIPVLGAILEPSAENFALGMAIVLSGWYTVGWYLMRRWWRPRLSRRPLVSAVVLGAFNAAVIETLFLICQKLTGAQDIAAHPNLIIDLLIFVRVQNRRRFAWPAVLLLGALYEMGADGVVAQIIGLLFGESQLFNLFWWVEMGIFSFWAFMLVYCRPPGWSIRPPCRRPYPLAPLGATRSSRCYG
jgi:hypothetical protein